MTKKRKKKVALKEEKPAIEKMVESTVEDSFPETEVDAEIAEELEKASELIETKEDAEPDKPVGTAAWLTCPYTGEVIATHGGQQVDFTYNHVDGKIVYKGRASTIKAKMSQGAGRVIIV